jgi:hypothetical protein
MADNNDFTHEFQIYTTDLNAGTMGTGKFLLFDNNINALKVESIDNIKIGGGTNGKVLATDGEGNLRWISAAAVTGGISSYNELDDLPTLFSGSYNDLTNKPTIPGEVSLGNFTFSLGDASLPAGGTMTLSTYRSGANEESRLTLSPTTESSLYAAGVLKLGTGYGSGSEQYWQFGTDGSIRFPDASVQTTAYTGSDHEAYEITNTSPEGSIYSVSVGTDGVVTMTTARGGIEFGAMPEVGGPSHLHIMRPAGQNSSTDLYFGDDYNYVKMPGLYGSNPTTQQGVEIGSSLNEGTVSVWKFGTDGDLTTPSSLVIGSRPGGGSHIQQNDAALEIVGEGANSVVQIGWTANQSAPDSVALIAMNLPNGGEGNVLIAVGNNATTVNYWLFDNTGNLTLPAGGDIKDSTGTSVLGGGFSGVYADLTSKPTLFDGDYNSLTNKPTYRIAVPTGTGPGGNLQADSLALAGLNPTENIPSTYGGDLILQGGVGGANGDLYGEVRIKSGTIGANYEWHFTTDKKIKLPAGGSIVDSTGANVFVSLTTLKQVVADSTDFADFQSRIAGM